MKHSSRQILIPVTAALILLLTLMSIAPGLGAEVRLPNVSFRGSLDLMVVDRVELSTDVRRSIVRELESILAEDLVDSGLQFRLEFLDEREAAEALRRPSAGQPCCRVRVNLWPRDGSFLRVPTTALGAVLLTGEPEPHIAHVFFPVVAEILGGRRGSTSRVAPPVLGRALARVMAHELVHALDAGTRDAGHGHSRTGVMQRHFSKGLLETSMPVPLDRSSIEGLVRGLEARQARALQGARRRSSFALRSIPSGWITSGRPVAR